MTSSEITLITLFIRPANVGLVLVRFEAAGVSTTGKHGPTGGFTGSGAFSMSETPEGTILVGGRNKLQEFNGRTWSLLRDGLDSVRSNRSSRRVRFGATLAVDEASESK